MTTELEQEFFKVFGIEPTIIDACKITDEYWNNEELADKYGCFALYMREKCPYDEDCNDNCEYAFDKIEYPEITDRKLLQLLCIYNDMQGCIDLCITPCKYEDVKEMTLHFLIDEKMSITDYEEGTYMDVMTNQIQQLFKEEECQ